MKKNYDLSYGKGEALITPPEGIGDFGRIIKDRVAMRVSEEQFDIPLLPTVAAKSLQMINNPKSSFQQISDLVSQDQVIAARVIKMANSPFYRTGSSIVTLRDAMSRIGLRTVKEVIFSLSMQDKVFCSSEFEGLMRQMWRHSVACAAAAQLLAKKAQVDSEYAFVAGLLHDIGKVLLIDITAGVFREFAQRDEFWKHLSEKKQQENFIEWICAHFHEKVGALVAAKWKLPGLLLDVIRYHHHVEKAKDARVMTTIVYLANMLCHHYGFGHPQVKQKLFEEPLFYQLNFSKADIVEIEQNYGPMIEESLYSFG